MRSLIMFFLKINFDFYAAENEWRRKGTNQEKSVRVVKLLDINVEPDAVFKVKFKGVLKNYHKFIMILRMMMRLARVKMRGNRVRVSQEFSINRSG